MKKIILLITLTVSSSFALAEEYKMLFNKVEKPFKSDVVEAAGAAETSPDLSAWLSFFNGTCGSGLASEAEIATASILDCTAKSISSLPSSGLSNVNGSLMLNGNSLNSLSGLDSLVSVGGNLNFSSNGLNDISSLSSLDSVGGYLSLHTNNFTNVNGLINLTHVGGSISFQTNTALNDLSGLENVDGLTNMALPYKVYSVKIPSSAPICQNNVPVSGFDVVNWVWVNPMDKTMYCD